MNLTIKNVFRKARRALLTAAAMLSVASASAQTTVQTTFKVCPLNVDGLPQKFAGINLNPDGPGSEGTQKIAQYIVKSGIDVLGLSEDFNYNGDLKVGLDGQYQMGTWRGRIALNNEGNVDLMKLRFPTDGLQFLVKNGYSFDAERWAPWNQNYGHFSDGADELITKGYRYYRVNFGQNIVVEFYIMHMDAETSDADNKARASQWEQLRDAIIANNSGLPKIVMGDTNSRYTRDDILNLFTNPIVADGNYTVSDVWVEKCKGGLYPELGSEALVVPEADRTKSSAYVANEIVDKVLYLNPTHGGMQLTPNSIVFDADNYLKADGTLLGDHVPVVVEFRAEGTTYAPATSDSFWRGETWVGNDQAVYLYNVGSHYFVSNDFAPVVTNITQAPIWHIYGGDQFTISNEDGYRLQMGQSKSQQGVVSETGATTFNNHEPGITAGSHRIGLKDFVTFLDRRTHFFTVATEKGKKIYTAAETKDVYNDWLLISEEQKQAYLTYVGLYNKALSLLGTREDLDAPLSSVLQDTQNSNYSRSADDIKKLQDMIAEYERLNVKITDAKFATTCLPWNGIVPAGVKVFTATKYDDKATPCSVILKSYEGDVLPQGVGVVLFSETPGTYTFTRTDAEAAAPADNILSGTYKRIAGGNLDFENHNYMLLGNKTAGVGFYRLAEDSYIPAYRAYILRDKTAASLMAKVVFSDATGVAQVEMPTNAKATGVYGIAGDKRSKMVRGINIVRMSDGSVRKLLVK